MKRRLSTRAPSLIALFIAPMIGAVQATAPSAPEAFAYIKDRPALGFWIGHVDLEKAQPFIAIEIATDKNDAVVARLTLLEFGAVNAECDEASIDGRSVTIVKKLTRPLRFKGMVSDDGQTIEGTVKTTTGGDQSEGDAGKPPRAFTLHRSLRADTAPKAKAFTGDLVIPSRGKLGLTLVLANTPGGQWVGSSDVPAQAIFSLPLIDITDTDGNIHATMPIPVFPATIEARIDKDKDALIGHFKQAAFDLELNLPCNHTYASPTLNRPQHPKPPYPYDTREVTIPTTEEFTLAGTLTLPKSGAPFAAAILITGSGQQDRDETLMGHKPFLVIADYLTRQGFAVLRCDDRGVGSSKGAATLEKATSEDFSHDVAAMVDYLKQQPEIDARRIGLIGHSEGGLIAPMVAAARDDVAFIVLLAGPGVNGADILRVQGRKILEAEGMEAHDIEAYAVSQDKVLTMATNGADETALRQEIAALVDDEAAKRKSTDATSQASTQPDVASSMREQQIDAQVKAISGAWMRYFLTFDPRPTLAKVKCPVLALNGTLDLQVWHEQNLPEVGKAVRSGGGDVTIKRYENLNHLFQPAKTGGISEYATIETTFDERVLADIVGWLNSKVGAAPASP